MARRGELAAIAIVAGASAGCFNVSNLLFDSDGGPVVTCGPFENPGVSSLVTHFADGGVSLGWEKNDECIREQGGDLVAAPVPGQESFCEYITTSSYHLGCDALTVKVPQAATLDVAVQTFIYIVPDADAGASVQLLLQGSFGLYTPSAQLGTKTTIYDPKSAVWWRLGALPGTTDAGGVATIVAFDTSPDGKTWTNQQSATVPVSLDSVRIHLGAGEVSTGIQDPGQARFECYNAPDACP